MRIKFDSITLNKEGQPPKHFQTKGKNLIAYQYAIDSPHALIEQKQNFLSTLIFEIERSHLSEEDAVKFALEHHLEMKKSHYGDLIFFDELKQASYLTASNTVLSNISITLNNLSTTTKYEFIGVVK